MTSFPKGGQQETARAAIAVVDYQAVTLAVRALTGPSGLAKAHGTQRSEVSNPARTRPFIALLESSHVMIGMRYFAGTYAPIDP